MIISQLTVFVFRILRCYGTLELRSLDNYLLILGYALKL
jgi:hypothetical protein